MELPPPYSLTDGLNANPTPQQSPKLPLSTSSSSNPSPGPSFGPSLGPSLGPTPSPSLGPTPSPSLGPTPGPSPGQSPNPTPRLEPNVPLPNPIPTNDGASSTLPPQYSDSTAFSIGGKSLTKPLVTVEQVKSHLRLLRAFKRFQEKVEDPYSDPGMEDVLPPIGRSVGAKGRWLWFLEMAVERFRRWLLSLATSDGFFIVPPVDVWLVWHTYMLNPMWYMEDRERVWFLRPLRDLEEHPMDLAAAMGDDILNYVPTADQEGIWEADVDIECPKCERPINVSFVNTEDMGFAQPEFVTVCPHCETLVTRESLGVSKFIRDIVLDPGDRSHVQMHGKGVYLAGSLLSREGAVNTYIGRRVKDGLKVLHVFRKDNTPQTSGLPHPDMESWKKEIGERLRYSSAELRKNVDQAKLEKSRMRRIMGAYTDGKPFSIELVAAAMRQSMFTDRIYQLGWLDPAFLGNMDSNRVLQYCIIRYYGFLTLIQKIPESGTFFVPTLDIDLAWHTHQLAPTNYSKDCKSIIGKVIDHDDQVEEANLANGLDVTAKAWRKQFGTPYMYCGCPLKETSTRQRLARASSTILSNRSRMEPPMNRDDCYSATHPSEHNSILILNKSWRNTRETEWRRRREKEGEKIGKGKSRSKDTELEERYLRGRSHDFPFLMPLAKTYGYGCPRVQQNYPGGCAAGVSGSF